MTKHEKDEKIEDIELAPTRHGVNRNQTKNFNKEVRNFIINGTKPKKFVSNSIKTAKYNA